MAANLSAVEARARTDCATVTLDAYEELRLWFRRFDLRHERERDIFTQLGYLDVQHLASSFGVYVIETNKPAPGTCARGRWRHAGCCGYWPRVLG